MKRIVFIFSTVAISFVLQVYISLKIEKEFIATLLTIFSIIFGFYVTSFSVFATSKYLARLYQIENPKDNRKTLLDDLLAEFTFTTYFLLTSIIYLIVLYIIIENSYGFPLLYLSLPLWGFLILNSYYAFRSISIFIKVTRQSAKN